MRKSKLQITLAITGACAFSAAYADIVGDADVTFCSPPSNVNGHCIVRKDAQDPEIEFTWNCFFDKGGTPLQYQANDWQPSGAATSTIIQTLSHEWEKTYCEVNNTLVTSPEEQLLAVSDCPWSGCPPGGCL